MFGVLRSCHTAPARAYYGGPEVVIRWYFADPAAPLYAGRHVWEPICYRKDRQITDGSIGELPGRRQPWYSGANPGVRLESEPCGTAADYRGEGTVPRLPNGQLDFARWCACAYRVCVGWEARSRFTKKVKAEIAWEVAVTDYPPVDRRYVTELAVESLTNELPQTGGWYFHVDGGASYTHPEEDHVCFFAQDSENCGGSNPNRQRGHAKKHFTFEEGTVIRADLTGRVERHQEPFDTIRIFIDGAEVFYHGAIGAGEGCAMEDVSDTMEVEVGAGDHQIDVYFDTVDGLYHTGAFWCVEFTFEPGLSADVCVETEVAEADTAGQHVHQAVAVELLVTENPDDVEHVVIEHAGDLLVRESTGEAEHVVIEHAGDLLVRESTGEAEHVEIEHAGELEITEYP